MVIKRLPPTADGPKTENPTYEITKKNEKETKKKERAKPQPAIDPVTGGPKLKRPRKSNESAKNTNPKPKKPRLSKFKG